MKTYTTPTAYVVRYCGYELRADRSEPHSVYLTSPEHKINQAQAVPMLGGYAICGYDSDTFPREIVAELARLYHDQRHEPRPYV